MRIQFIEEKMAALKSLTENYFRNRTNSYEEVFEVKDFRIDKI